ncbi:hypothetical protein EON71_00910 [bacterium]|nr:MAG: hypothetical protein EON71_00910 [bacterium]
MRRRVNFLIRSINKFRINLFILLGYLVIFLFILRILKILQQQKSLDFNRFLSKDIFIIMLIVFVFLFFLRRLLVTYAKIVFFKVHYFLMSPETIGWHDYYARFFITKVYTPAVKTFKYFWFFNLILSIVVLTVVIKDLVFNNLVLDQSLIFLRWFGLFKFFYICIRFVAIKQNLTLDYYGYNLTYPGDIINGRFWNTSEPEMFDKETEYRFQTIAK